MSRTYNNLEGGILTEKKQRLKTPSLYKVILHNDDYTSMEFVVLILEKVFHKSTAEATRIMLDVHQQGIGVAGIYTREVAETKVITVNSLARRNEYPLKCTMEKL